MPSLEAHPQEQPLSAEQQHAWRVLVKQNALRSLEALEAFYLPEQEREARKNTHLTNERYQEWLTWMEEIDKDPTIPFKQHPFVDEVALVENIKVFTQAMEALEELRADGSISVATQERLGLPKIFRYASPEKLTLYSLTIGGKTPQQLEAELEARGFKIGGNASFMMKSRDFTTEKHQEELQLVRLTVDELFHDGQYHTTDQIFSKAKELGLELCPAEVGPHLRLAYKDQPFNEWIYVAMKHIVDSYGDPCVFGAKCDDDGSCLMSSLCAEPNDEWSHVDEFVFRLPR